MDQGRQILDLFRSRGLTPVLVLDDTDRWLTATWLPDSRQTRAAFFTTIPRLLSEELDAAAVIAVHPTYLDDAPSAPRAVSCPGRSPCRGAVGRRGGGDPVPADRVGHGRQGLPAVEVSDVLADAALVTVHDYYASRRPTSAGTCCWCCMPR